MSLKLGDMDIEDVIKDNSLQAVLIGGDSNVLKQSELSLIAYLVAKNMAVVIVTMNEPYRSLNRKLRNLGVETKKMIFIDAIAEHGGKIEAKGNCIFVNNPSNLTDLSIAIDGALNALKEFDVILMFDSISLLSKYNKPDEVFKFFHFLVSKIRTDSRMKGMFLFTGEGQAKILDELDQFCDVNIKI